MSVEVINDDENLGVYNIIAYQGKTFTRIFTWTDDNDEPINLTGATAAMKVRKFYPKTFIQAAHWDDPVISISSAAGDITIDELNGIISVTIDAATMATVTPDIYDYDLEITMGSQIPPFLTGTFEVKREATF